MAFFSLLLFSTVEMLKETILTGFPYQLKAFLKPSCGGLEVERPLRIQLKAGHSYLGGFESRLDMVM